jgi:hypothetical protein
VARRALAGLARYSRDPAARLSRVATRSVLASVRLVTAQRTDSAHVGLCADACCRQHAGPQSWRRRCWNPVHRFAAVPLECRVPSARGWQRCPRASCSEPLHDACHSRVPSNRERPGARGLRGIRPSESACGSVWSASCSVSGIRVRDASSHTAEGRHREGWTHEAPDCELQPGASNKGAGDGLLSRDLAAGVPSALSGLTTVFGMGTGVAPTL